MQQLALDQSFSNFFPRFGWPLISRKFRRNLGCTGERRAFDKISEIIEFRIASCTARGGRWRWWWQWRRDSSAAAPPPTAAWERQHVWVSPSSQCGGGGSLGETVAPPPRRVWQPSPACCSRSERIFKKFVSFFSGLEITRTKKNARKFREIWVAGARNYDMKFGRVGLETLV